jgi:hypothetical protein
VTTHISIKQAIKLLELITASKMTRDTREQSEAALADLRRALVDPHFRAQMSADKEATDGR